MTTPTCKTCRFFTGQPGVPFGEQESCCRRHAPALCYNRAFNTSTVAFPNVQADSWCGDHEPAEAAGNDGPEIDEVSACHSCIFMREHKRFDMCEHPSHGYAPVQMGPTPRVGEERTPPPECPLRIRPLLVRLKEDV